MLTNWLARGLPNKVHLQGRAPGTHPKHLSLTKTQCHYRKDWIFRPSGLSVAPQGGTELSPDISETSTISGRFCALEVKYSGLAQNGRPSQGWIPGRWACFSSLTGDPAHVHVSGTDATPSRRAERPRAPIRRRQSARAGGSLRGSCRRPWPPPRAPAWPGYPPTWVEDTPAR